MGTIKVVPEYAIMTNDGLLFDITLWVGRFSYI
jgi:hypothetical protein